MARRSFGTARKLPSGRWQARYRTPSGKQVGLRGTFATKADAGRALARIQADMDRGQWRDPNAGRLTLAAYAERWVTSRLVRGRPLAPRTVELYRSELTHHILPPLGAVELRRLDAAAVRAWYGALSRAEKPGQVTVAKCYRLLRAICQTAMEDDLIARNPCAIRGAGQESSPERPMFSVEQVDALAEAVDERWRAMILLAAWVGLRFGELAGLRRTDLDLAAGTVTVVKAKSEAGKRTVAIPPHIIPILANHLTHYAEPSKTGLVFVGPKGGALRRNNFNADVWQAATRAAGLPLGSHPHDLRGFSATVAARHGATTRELMHRLASIRGSVGFG